MDKKLRKILKQEMKDVVIKGQVTVITKAQKEAAAKLEAKPN